MKKEFFDFLTQLMHENPDIYFLTGGLGYPRIDELLQEFPERVINCEASEQTMMDVAVGLSYAGKIPFVYTITPFYWRAAETLRTYINHEKLHCVLIGAGVDEEYGEHDGFSHSGSDIKDLFKVLKNFRQHYPDNTKELHKAMETASNSYMPTFINIHR